MNKRAIAFLQKMEEVKKAKATKQKQLQEKLKTSNSSVSSIQQSTPTQELRTNFPYTCERCKGFICYDVLFVNDFTGKYIPLDRETMRTHHCSKKGNGVINVDIE